MSQTIAPSPGEAGNVTRISQLNVRVEPELHRALEALARDNERSVSAEVRRSLRRHLAYEQLRPGTAA